MSKGISNRTKKLTVSTMMTALGVALMFMGSLIETIDLSMAALASFFCVFAVIELGGAYPWLIFAATGVLSVIFMPYSMGGWFYVLFFGYYPILKEKLEKLNKIISWVVKILILNAALVACVALAYFMFYGQSGAGPVETFMYIMGGGDVAIYVAVGIYLLVNVVFVVYDLALTRLITYYFFKLRHRFKFLNFK